MEQISNFQFGVFVTTVVVLIGYPLVMRFLARRMAVKREKLADTARTLLQSTHLSEEQKVIVERMMDSSMSWRVMFFASVTLPVYLIGRRLRVFDPVPVPKLPADRDTAKKLIAFTELHIQSVAAANPFFAFILALEVACLVLMLVPLGMLSSIRETVVRAFVIAEDRRMRWHHS